jgi:hypothetical protein
MTINAHQFNNQLDHRSITKQTNVRTKIWTGVLHDWKRAHYQLSYQPLTFFQFFLNSFFSGAKGLQTFILFVLVTLPPAPKETANLLFVRIFYISTHMFHSSLYLLQTGLVITGSDRFLISVAFFYYPSWLFAQVTALWPTSRSRLFV